MRMQLPNARPRPGLPLAIGRTCLLLASAVALIMAGQAAAQGNDEAPLWRPRPLFSGEVALPDRIVRSDIVVLGRVVAMEPKDVQAILSPARTYDLHYRIAVVKVDEVIHGKKEVKELRVGFVSPEQDRTVDKNGKPMLPLAPHDSRPLNVGQEGLFILRKHHQGGFFVNFMLSGGFVPRDAPDFTKVLENVRKLAGILERPLEALKSGNATNRYLAAGMLINRHRLHGAKGITLPEQAIDAEESRLLLKTLAEAGWENVNEAISSSNYPTHPYQIFLQLGVAGKDGYQPPVNPADFREILGYARRWLQDNQENYRIRRFTADSK